MDKCCVCAVNVREDAYVFGESEKRKCTFYLCEHCEAQMNRLTESQNYQEIAEAVKYFENRLDKVEDEAIKEQLRDMLEANAAAAKDMKTNPNAKRASVSSGTVYVKRERFEDAPINQPQNYGDGSVWISGLRFFAKLFLVLAIIVGVVVCADLWNANTAYAVGFMLGIWIAGFITTAGIMIFIDMAMDIRHIRKQLSGKK